MCIFSTESSCKLCHFSWFKRLITDPERNDIGYPGYTCLCHTGSDTFVEVGMPRSPSHSANGSELKQMLASCKTSSGKRQAVELLQGTKNSHLQYVSSFTASLDNPFLAPLLRPLTDCVGTVCWSSYQFLHTWTKCNWITGVVIKVLSHMDV